MKTFDKYVAKTIAIIPLLGKRLAKEYLAKLWMQQLARFVLQTFVVFWLVKSPLIYMLTAMLPPISLVLFVIPSYLLAAFVAGVIVTLVGFIITKHWVFKK